MKRFLYCPPLVSISSFFFFNDTATTEIYTLSLHDALPISVSSACARKYCAAAGRSAATLAQTSGWKATDRKSTRLNSSHSQISYAVFCLKKKNKIGPIMEIHKVVSIY